MIDELKMLIAQVRSLPPQERITLIEEALDSLDHGEHPVDQLWAREAHDRLAAYRRGDLATKDFGSIIAKYRA